MTAPQILGPKQPRMGLILSTWTDDDPPEWAVLAAENQQKYAQRWGYEFRFDRVDRAVLEGATTTSYTWSKVYALKKALMEPNWRFIFLIDADSIFCDFGRSLEDLFRKRRPLIATGDQNDLFNTGHLFVKPNPDTLLFVNRWWSLQSLQWPTLPTTHQERNTGLVNDQVAFNYLAAGGEPTQARVSADGLQLFNRTNGYPGNQARAFKKFHKWFAPTVKWRTASARILLSRKSRKLFGIVTQQRLNWYPTKGESLTLRYPILHYPGDLKSRLSADLETLASW
jgi:hypothetical protein